MKHLVFATLAVLLVGNLAIGAARAEGAACTVPAAEWQSKEALQQKLQAEGWTIKTVKVDKGCYEVYGTDATGKRMETYFDPKSFTVVQADD
jgi:hypothetical protein